MSKVMSLYLDMASLGRQWAFQALSSRGCGSDSQEHVISLV